MSTERRKRNCNFCKDGDDQINYLNVGLLSKFVTPSGKILPSRVTRVCPKHQRKLRRAIMQAREIALLPYVKSLEW
ncbi:MAG: 30S ribosomal protein S18 [candidate division WOR-3 bacterium]